MLCQVLPGTILNDRYRIIKPLFWRTSGGVYEAWDFKITEKRWIIKEIIPPKMPEEELLERRAYFHESIDTLKSLSHPNLAKMIDSFSENGREYVVVEHIEGITFDHFIGVISRLGEKQALEIAINLCQAVEYLHNRPKPLFFAKLDIKHIMLDYNRQLKFIGYDFTVFFTGPYPHAYCYDSPEQMQQSVYLISKILLFLIAGAEEATQELIPENISVSRELENLLKKALLPGQQAYSSIGAFSGELDKINDPEKYRLIEEEKLKAKKAREIVIPTLSSLIDKPREYVAAFSRAFLAQKSYMLMAEFIFIFSLILIALFISIQNIKKPYCHPQSRVVAVFAGNELNIYDSNGKDLIYTKPLRSVVSGAYPLNLQITMPKKEKPECRRVFLVGYEDLAVLDIIDSETLETIQTIKVEKDPVKMLPDENMKFLYILHKSSGIISIVDLSTLKLVKIFSTGSQPFDFVYIPMTKEQETLRKSLIEQYKQGKLEGTVENQMGQSLEPQKHFSGMAGTNRDIETIPDKINDQEVPAPALIMSNSGSKNIIVINAWKGRVKSVIPFDGTPAGLAFDRNEEKLYAANSDADHIITYVFPDMVQNETVLLPDKNPTDIIFDALDGRFWIAMRESNAVNILESCSKKVARITLSGKYPIKISLDKQTGNLWIANEATKDVEVYNIKTFRKLSRISIGKPVSAVIFE